MKFTNLDKTTQIILKVALVALALFFLWEIREILVILLLALILASAMEPMVDYLHTHKIPRPVSVGAVYLLVLGIFVMIIYAVVPLVVTQSKILATNLPEYFSDFQNRFGNILSDGENGNVLQNFLSNFSSSNSLISGTYGFFNAVISLIAILVISFYLVAEHQGMKRFISLFVPKQHQQITVTVLEKIQKKMGLWVLGQVIACAVMFVITYLGLLLLGIKYALVLALIAGVLEVAPYVGPIISAIPAMFFGLIQGGVPLAFIVALMYFLLHELEGYVLIPKIMEKTVGGTPLMILLAVLIGLKLAGPIGILIAIPLVGALNVVVEEMKG